MKDRGFMKLYNIVIIINDFLLCKTTGNQFKERKHFYINKKILIKSKKFNIIKNNKKMKNNKFIILVLMLVFKITNGQDE